MNGYGPAGPEFLRAVATHGWAAHYLAFAEGGAGRLWCGIGFLGSCAAGISSWVLLVISGFKAFQARPLGERGVSTLSRSWVTSKLAGTARIRAAEAGRWRRVGRVAFAAFFASLALGVVFGCLAHFERSPWP